MHVIEWDGSLRLLSWHSCVPCLQFVYDTWYSVLTPDREFPREIRRILNTAFGELAGRARRADVRKMLLGCALAMYIPSASVWHGSPHCVWCD